MTSSTSRNWDGISPRQHLDSSKNCCNFCGISVEHLNTTGSYELGLLLTCENCKPGLDSRLIEILGTPLHKKMMIGGLLKVSCSSNGPDDFWYFLSKLPVMDDGKWKLHMQSHWNPFHDSCQNKLVSVDEIKELNK